MWILILILLQTKQFWVCSLVYPMMSLMVLTMLKEVLRIPHRCFWNCTDQWWWAGVGREEEYLMMEAQVLSLPLQHEPLNFYPICMCSFNSNFYHLSKSDVYNTTTTKTLSLFSLKRNKCQPPQLSTWIPKNLLQYHPHVLFIAVSEVKLSLLSFKINLPTHVFIPFPIF